MNRRDFFKRTAGALTLALMPRPEVSYAELEQAYRDASCGMVLRVSDSPEFAFGFTGFLESDNDGTYAGYMGIPRVPIRLDDRHWKMISGVAG